MPLCLCVFPPSSCLPWGLRQCLRSVPPLLPLIAPHLPLTEPAPPPLTHSLTLHLHTPQAPKLPHRSELVAGRQLARRNNRTTLVIGNPERHDPARFKSIYSVVHAAPHRWVGVGGWAGGWVVG
jgi:hypothetical protein